MIAAAPAPVVESAVAVAFAPQTGAPYRYRYTKTRPPADRPTHVAITQSITFTAEAKGGWIATVVATGHKVDGPSPSALAAIEALLVPFEGVPVSLMIDRHGEAGAVVNGQAAWQGILASYANLLNGQAAAGLDAASLASIRDLAAGYRTMPPEARDETLRAGASTLLAPPLPVLRLGEERAFTATIPTPFGTVSAAGTTRLVAATAERLDYETILRTRPGAVDGAIAALLATLPPDDARRAAMTAAAAPMKGASFSQRTILVIERRTGLLLETHSVRERIAADGTSTEIDRGDLMRVPAVP